MSRLALYNCVELKDYKEAYRYGNHLFRDTEKHKETWQDKYYMALACQGANQSGQAIDWFRRCTQADDIAQRERNESYRNIAKIYKDLGEYDQASKAYDKLYELQKAENNISAQDINMHARLFLEQSTEVNGDEVFECYRKANQLYELLAEVSPDNAGLAYHAILQNSVWIRTLSRAWRWRLPIGSSTCSKTNLTSAIRRNACCVMPTGHAVIIRPSLVLCIEVTSRTGVRRSCN